MGEIFGAIGSVAAAAITADAIQEATERQIEALEEQREWVFSQLDPTVISGMATAADVERAKNRLALQAITDPALLGTRYAAQESVLRQLGGLETGPGDVVAQQAAAEALRGGGPEFEALKHRLIDTALTEIESGATLPPDLQAELVKSGLEKGGMVSGAASPRGFGGEITRRLIGREGLNLQAERQGRAVALGQAASALEQERARLLAQLFPSLKATQLQNLQAAGGAFELAAGAVPQAGLGGGDIANIWMARVGAANQLAQAGADVAARGAMGQAQAIGQGIGQATGYAAGAFPSTQQFFAQRQRPTVAESASAVGLGW